MKYFRIAFAPATELHVNGNESIEFRLKDLIELNAYSQEDPKEALVHRLNNSSSGLNNLVGPKKRDSISLGRKQR